METKIATSFKLDRELHKSCKIAAVIRGVTISDFLEDAIDYYINSIESPGWKHKGLEKSDTN